MSVIMRGGGVKNDYPTSDGRPMAETDHHRKLMYDLIETLDEHFTADPMVYVSGNLLVYYVPGDRLWHLSPDVFVAKGVPKRERLNYLMWEEGKGPDVVIELTSSSMRDEDVDDKFQLYQNNLRVPEYFLFDPHGDYLDPPLRGYRLNRGRYSAIRAVKGRLPSKVLGLHLERQGRRCGCSIPLGACPPDSASGSRPARNRRREWRRWSAVRNSWRRNHGNVWQGSRPRTNASAASWTNYAGGWRKGSE